MRIDYIDFGVGDQLKEDLDYTKGYMDGMATMIYAIKDSDTAKWYLTRGILEETHERYQINPHWHYSSILGPYCVACRCNLPGPNGEWE